MGAPVELTESEKTLHEQLRALTESVRIQGQELMKKGRRDGFEEINSKIGEMAKLAHHLHLALLKRDPSLEPRHHAYMIRNRGSSPRDPEFYDHFHPVEDLLKFIDDRDANDDPEDTTLGEEFTFEIYSQRWGHPDTYRLVRTPTGWNVHFISIGGPCDPRGEPYLYENLRHDSISYPSTLPDHLEELWRHASAEGGGLTREQVQDRLDGLAKWVSETERNAPKTA